MQWRAQDPQRAVPLLARCLVRGAASFSLRFSCPAAKGADATSGSMLDEAVRDAMSLVIATGDQMADPPSVSSSAARGPRPPLSLAPSAVRADDRLAVARRAVADCRPRAAQADAPITVNRDRAAQMLLVLMTLDARRQAERSDCLEQARRCSGGRTHVAAAPASQLALELWHSCSSLAARRRAG